MLNQIFLSNKNPNIITKITGENVNLVSKRFNWSSDTNKPERTNRRTLICWKFDRV